LAQARFDSVPCEAALASGRDASYCWMYLVPLTPPPMIGTQLSLALSSTVPSQSLSLPSQISADEVWPGVVIVQVRPVPAPLHLSEPLPWHTPMPLSVHGLFLSGNDSSVSPSQSLSLLSQLFSGTMLPIASFDTVDG
jgi:hypothetical protein